jgi:transposase
VDVPAKLAARVRLFDTGHNRKTDAHDAHSIAMVAVRTTGLRVLTADPELEALRMLVERRESLSRRRVQTVDRLHALLAELLPGQAKKDLTTGQAKRLLASVRPRDIAGMTRRRIAAEELAELIAVEAKMRKATTKLKAIILARGSHMMDLQTRHRLSRAGNRRINHMIHIAAISQLRLDTEGRAYYRRKRADGKRPLEAIRCLKRRISDAIYRQLVADTAARNERADAGPGGHHGATLQSSAAGSHPLTGTSDQPLPGPAPKTLRPTALLGKPNPGNGLQATG